MLSRIGIRKLSNYYKLFPKTLPNGPPPKGPYQIDTKSLRNEYLSQQQQAHPDTKTGSTDSSAELGNAYRTLSDPLLRAQHILNLNGIDTLSEAEALHDEDLLMEIMLIREEAAEAETESEKDRIRRSNQGRIDSSIERIDNAFKSNDLDEAHNATIELSYWLRLKESLDEPVENYLDVNSVDD